MWAGDHECYGSDFFTVTILAWILTPSLPFSYIGELFFWICVLVLLYVLATIYCGIDEEDNNIPDEGLVLLVGNCMFWLMSYGKSLWNEMKHASLLLCVATESEVDDPEPVQVLPETRANRGRKRGIRTSRGIGSVPSKRGRRISSSVDVPLLPPPEPQPPPRVEQEKPDANMCLKVWAAESLRLKQSNASPFQWRSLVFFSLHLAIEPGFAFCNYLIKQFTFIEKSSRQSYIWYHCIFCISVLPHPPLCPFKAPIHGACVHASATNSDGKRVSSTLRCYILYHVFLCLFWESYKLPTKYILYFRVLYTLSMIHNWMKQKLMFLVTPWSELCAHIQKGKSDVKYVDMYSRATSHYPPTWKLIM